MACSITLGPWEQQRAHAEKIRLAVFVEEQGVPIEMEWDEMDAPSLHALMFTAEGACIATGRLLPDGHIGRMAVKREYRGRGAGGEVLRALVQAARERGDAFVLLHAQTQAEDFYRRFGFVPEGEEFMEAGIVHRLMRKVFA